MKNPIELFATLGDRLAAAWPFIKGKIDRDAEMYRKKCEKSAEAINAR